VSEICKNRSRCARSSGTSVLPPPTADIVTARRDVSKVPNIGCASHQFIAVATSFFRTNEGSGRHESARRDQVGMPDETKFKGRLIRR
jgi:hypothetical protein